MAETAKNNKMQPTGAERILDPFKYGRGFLLVLLLILLLGFLYVIRMFILPVVLAAVFAGLFFPLFKKIQKLFKGKSSLASLVTCVLLLAGLLAPVYFIADQVAREAIDLYHIAEEKVQETLALGEEGPLGWVNENVLSKLPAMEDFDWQTSLTDILKSSGSIIADALKGTSSGTFKFIMDLFIVLFTMFYFFQDGDSLIRRIKQLSPLGHTYEDLLLERFKSVSGATIKGSLLLGLIQGVLGGLILWAFGIPSVLLWSVVMVLLSIVPMLGGWLVMYPAAIVKLAVGDIWQGIAIMLISTLVIGNIDNLLRPRLVGKDAGMHDLMIFFTTLGGIAVFK